MLDRAKLLKEFSLRLENLFPDYTAKKVTAVEIWNKISSDPMFSQIAAVTQSSFLIPGWSGNLTDTVNISSQLKQYSVLSIDGSQIYPDRNMPGSGCFLINIGGTLLNYGEKSGVKLFSQPQLLMPEDFDNSVNYSKELIDLKREEVELQSTYEIALENNFSNNVEKVCLFDGSLIFWHLDSKAPEVKELFLKTYLNYLNKFYENKILIAGYISMPKSKELINLIKLGLCRFAVADCIGCHRDNDTFPCKEVDNLLDTHIAKHLLKPNNRTTLFWSTSKIVTSYPLHLKPYFFYLNTGKEIARIEIPAWIAESHNYVDQICKIALDQSNKGQGYPISIAEAHEQAVVKGVDRDFFYHLVFKAGIEKNRSLKVSQKSLKKRGMNI